MGTISENQIVTTNTDYNLAKASMRLKLEVMEEDTLIGTLKKFGVINYEEDLTRQSGTIVTMYNSPRFSFKPNVGDVDHYSNAVSMDVGNRQVEIRLQTGDVKYKLNGSETRQIAEFDLSAEAPKKLLKWGSHLLRSHILNQVGGNTATTIVAPTVSDDTYTTADERKIICGNNTPAAPSTLYKAIGSEGAGGVTTDEGITSSNTLKLVDFLNAREIITSVSSGVPMWATLNESIEGFFVEGIAVVTVSGMNQLKKDATAGAYNFTQIQYAKFAGGNDLKVGKSQNMYYLENILFIEVPDYFMPRGVHSSTAAAVANTRRAVILGAGAVDVAAGKGYSFGKDSVGGFSVETDLNEKKNNKVGFTTVGFNGGAKKAQIYGTGTNANTLYDCATYVITHYAR